MADGLHLARVLRRALARGEGDDAGVPPKEAIEYFRGKGIQPGFSYLDVWREEHAFAFTVAREMRLDVLADIRDGLDKALAKGETFETWRKQLQPNFEAWGWDGDSRHRLRTIYLTNMRVARAAGHWHRVQRTKADRPYLMYRIGPSNVHRPLHVEWNGVILPVDDSFWGTHYPPNGWGCKCYVRQLSARQAEALGGVTARPDMSPEEHEVRGERVFVPKGIDPGWDFNPGHLRTPPPAGGVNLPPAHPAAGPPVRPRVEPPAPRPARPPKFQAVPTEPAEITEFLGDEASLLHLADHLEPNTRGWSLEPGVAHQMALEHRARWKPGNQQSTKLLFARMQAELEGAGRSEGNLPKMRGLMRRFVSGALPEIASRDLLRAAASDTLEAGESARPLRDMFLFRARMPDKRTLAYHSSLGRVGMGRGVSTQMLKDVRALARGRTVGIKFGLNAAVHEELHGYSPAFTASSRGPLGSALEEASTEILARRVMRTLIGAERMSEKYGVPYRGAYQVTISAVLHETMDHLRLGGSPKGADIADVLEVVEQAAIHMRRPGRPALRSGTEYARALADEIGQVGGIDEATTSKLYESLVRNLQGGSR